MKQLTFKQYRNIDLGMLTVLIVVFEAIATFASGKWFAAQPIALSITLTMTCIALFRWNAYAAIVAVAGGLVFCFASGAAPHHYLIYSVGNLFVLLSLPLFKLFTKEKMRKSIPKLLLFVATNYLLLQLGRWLVALMFSAGFSDLVGYLVSDVISLLLAAVVIPLLRNTDGMIEDQKAYLFKLERQRREEQASPPESQSHYLDY